jgi:GPH family glycoside/pentoside/hexuronide:cation symporter
VNVEVGHGQGSVWVRVHDTGPGVPERERVRIFEPFAQGDTSATRRHGTTGLVIILCGIVPGLLVPERTRAVSQQAIRIGGALKAVWRNRPFVKLVALALLQIGTGTVTVMIAEYVNFYHVYGGNLAPAAFVSSTGMTVGYSLAFASAFLWTRLSTRYEKRTVLLVTIAGFALVNAGTWWLYTPDHPYLQILYRALNMPIVFGFWLMVQSMIADTCEFEEWNSGFRRDGIMGACVTWAQKMGVSVAFLLGGLVLDLSGFQARLKGAQPAEALLAMRIAMVAFPVAGMLLAAWVARSYPLDRAAMKRLGAEVQLRRATMETAT